MAEKAKSQGEKDRERELARRQAHAEAARQQVSIIVHGPVAK